MEAAIKFVGLFILVIAFALAYRGPKPMLPPDTISGVYTNAHQITVPSEDVNAPNATEVMDDVTDKLTVTRQKDGSIKFKAELVFSYYHVCDLEAVAKPVDGGYEYVQEDDIITQRCKLGIHVDDDSITFADPTMSCRDSCGARGYFDQVSFPRSSKQPLAESPTK